MKTILVDAVYCFVIEDGGNFKVFREMYDMLETFPNRKIILTGADDGQFKNWGLDVMPYEVFTLKHTPEKTNPEYYKKMLEHFGLEKDDVMYFEHNPEAVKSAQSVGIKSYFYDNDKKDLEALKDFLMKNLMNYEGVIIEESLKNKAVLGEMEIVGTKIEPVTDEHKTPWVKQWTLHTVKISKEKAAEIAKKISGALDSRHNWYADFKTDNDHYIIFRNKVFYVTDRTSKEQYDEVTKYGLTLGIPEYQLDFSPYIKRWKR